MSTLHEMLKRVRREGLAICSQVMGQEEYTVGIEQELDALLHRWPERWPDCACTPVEGKLSKFIEAAEQKILWQNPRRHALLDWLLKETKP